MSKACFQPEGRGVEGVSAAGPRGTPRNESMSVRGGASRQNGF